MANPGNAQVAKSLDPELFKVSFSATTADGANPTSQDLGNGIRSLTRTGEGVYRLTLAEAWSGINDYSIRLIGATATFAQVTTDNSATTTGANARTVDFTLFQEAAGVLTANDSQGLRLVGSIWLKNRVARR